jgi:hypothetical protein
MDLNLRPGGDLRVLDGWRQDRSEIGEQAMLK